MLSSGTMVLLVCVATLAVIQQTSCQLSLKAISIPQIISLLENVTDTSMATSSILPHLKSSLQKQEDMWILSNLLLSNSTATLKDIAQIFLQYQEEHRDYVLSFNDAAIAQTEMVNLLQSHHKNDLQIKTILKNQQNSTDRTETTLTEMASIQTQMANAVTQMAITQSQMANTQSELRVEQTHTTNSLDQVVSLLQSQNQHLGNVSTSLANLIDQHNKQNQLLWISYPPDCSYLSRTSNPTGSYEIYPDGNAMSFRVRCDMETDGGGWTVLQRRYDGSVDFFLNWTDYEDGFGSVFGEHWLGLRQMHRLTRSGQWTLRIDMEDFYGITGYAQYEDFRIGDASSFYQLSIGAYSGTPSYDALDHHNGSSFSTKDSDHDSENGRYYDGSCSLRYKGAWWFNRCLQSNLNGLYRGSTSTIEATWSRMCWYKFSGHSITPLKKSELKIRRRVQ